MIYIPPIPELSVYGVIECGVPNLERICLRPSEEVNLAHFALLLAIRDKVTGELTPVNDHFFWFGEKIVTPPAWIIIFTASGENKTVIEKGLPVHIFCWGKKNVLFNVRPNVTIVPLLFRIGSFSMVPLLPNAAQVKQLSNK
jgi:hypothetical protein